MSTATKLYQSEQWTLIINGVLIDSGYNDGEFLTIKQAEKDFTAKVGADGEVTRSKSNNRLAIVNVKLMQTSSGNDLLSIMNNLDIATPGGAGIGAFLVMDQLGRAKYAAAKCWVSGVPDVTLDKEATMREWEITCSYLIRYDGGS